MMIRMDDQSLMDVADAEDAVQEVFLKLLQYKGEAADKEHVKAWLLRVVVKTIQCFYQYFAGLSAGAYLPVLRNASGG